MKVPSKEVSPNVPEVNDVQDPEFPNLYSSEAEAPVAPGEFMTYPNVSPICGDVSLNDIDAGLLDNVTVGGMFSLSAKLRTSGIVFPKAGIVSPLKYFPKDLPTAMFTGRSLENVNPSPSGPWNPWNPWTPVIPMFPWNPWKP